MLRYLALLLGLVLACGCGEPSSEREQSGAFPPEPDVNSEAEINSRLLEAEDLLKQGQSLAKEWECRSLSGSQTRARSLAEKTDGVFEDTRSTLNELQRIAREAPEARAKIDARLAELDAAQFSLRIQNAEYFFERDTYRPAEEWFSLAARIDPVDPRLARLRARIDKRTEELLNR